MNLNFQNQTAQNILLQTGESIEQAVVSLVGEQAFQRAIDASLVEDNPSRIVLVGGGGGSATVARALYSIGQRQFAMLAPTGKSLRYRRWPSPVEAEENDDDFTYWTDIVRMCLHGVPVESRNRLHALLDKRCKNRVFNGSFLLQELLRLGSRQAIAVLNRLLGNEYEVALTTEEKTHLRYVVGDQVFTFQQYIARIMMRGESTNTDHVFLSPEVSLSERARFLLEQARTVVIGPGDLTLTTQFHFLVNGFREALARNRDKDIAIIVNLSARDIDIPGYTVKRFLDHISHWLPGQRAWAIINTEPFVGCLPNDLLGQQDYGQFRLVSAPLLGTGYTDDQQPKHDSVTLGHFLNTLFFTNSLTFYSE